ncbi:hypothetical protein GX50_07270 [[Emmonsia] crescens]|uniref:Uncharacterized protein n=1 Tax=[Emmonsia] crescens TaxID=73230 RepID=A0A2B7Z989_9EURO|nr:hypothetical protein GX50_07270 [Emmonsia crescens]
MALPNESSQEQEELSRESWPILPNLPPLLGSTVPTIGHRASDASTPTPAKQGLILTRQPGTPLVELWPSLTASQRETVKAKLCDLLVHMRARHFAYYGRPTREPYLLFSEFRAKTHACCASRSEWDDSRIRALHASASDTERAVGLERVQRGTTGAGSWDRPVLTHMDLSDRNILVDPTRSR